MNCENIQPLTSVIVPVYNVEKYIARCIESILCQTYENFEIIVVNDGSTDDSRNIIENYAQAHRHITVHNQLQSGAPVARNAGLDKATGKYIYFVDADDYIHPQAIETLVANIEKYQSDFCCYRAAFFTECSVKKPQIDGNDFNCSVIIGNDDVLRDALLTNNIKITIWSKFFRSSFLQKHNICFVEGIIHDDYPFTISCATHATKVSFENKVLYYYSNARTGSITTDIRKENLTVYFRIFDYLEKYIRENGNFKIYEDYFYACYVKIILFTLCQFAFRGRGFAHYQQLFSALEGNKYKQPAVGETVKLKSLKIYWLYRVSLYPKLFFYVMRLVKLLNIKML